MAAAEAAMLQALKGTLKLGAWWSRHPAAADPIPILQPIIISTIAAAVKSGRGKARELGHSTLLGELASQVDDEDYPTDAPFVEDEEGDQNAALLAGFTFGRHWQRSVLLYIVGGMVARKAARAALIKHAWRLKMVATTETARAFNAEREASVLRYARTIKTATELAMGGAGIEAVPLAGTSNVFALDPPITRRQAQALRTKTLRPFLEWDAMRDACDECAKLHGMVVPADIGWTNGPPLHPNCRCMDNVLMLPASFQWAA